MESKHDQRSGPDEARYGVKWREPLACEIVNDREEIDDNAYTPEGDIHVVVLVPIAGE